VGRDTKSMSKWVSPGFVSISASDWAEGAIVGWIATTRHAPYRRLVRVGDESKKCGLNDQMSVYVAGESVERLRWSSKSKMTRSRYELGAMV
jgi:hypothetical protein